MPLQSPTGVNVAFIGIGNTLAGDDGAGVIALERLIRALSEADRTGYLFATLTGDLLSVTDFLDKARRFIFLDAIAGAIPGELQVIQHPNPQILSASFHQTDINAVMEMLRRIHFVEPFPPWEVRGITILPPIRLHEGLNPDIDHAVDRLVSMIVDEIRCRWEP